MYKRVFAAALMGAMQVNAASNASNAARSSSHLRVIASEIEPPKQIPRLSPRRPRPSVQPGNRKCRWSFVRSFGRSVGQNAA